MLFFNDVLTEDMITSVFKDIKSNFRTNSWGISKLKWDSHLHRGLSGCCYTTRLDEKIKKPIESHISNLLPEYDELYIDLHLMDVNSGIDTHTDECCKFAGTIYLNKEWSVDQGGLFMWQEQGEDYMRAICPKYNTMIINNAAQPHLVTAVSPFASQFRTTLQIWAP